MTSFNRGKEPPIENITKAEKPTRELDNQLESQLIKRLRQRAPWRKLGR